MEQNPIKQEKVSLRDNLPKIPADRQVEDLKKIYYASQTIKEKYFPLEKQMKYQNNFALFDRNDDKLLDYSELKEFLISIGQMISEEDLQEFYKVLAQNQEVQEGHFQQGITLDNIYFIVLKKLRQEDVEQQLQEAFKIADVKNEGSIQSDDFKQLLMTMGFKWGQQQADEFIKQFEPKSQKRIFPNQVIKKLMKR